jgi:hypothetical protein
MPPKTKKKQKNKEAHIENTTPNPIKEDVRPELPSNTKKIPTIGEMATPIIHGLIIGSLLALFIKMYITNEDEQIVLQVMSNDLRRQRRALNRTMRDLNISAVQAEYPNLRFAEATTEIVPQQATSGRLTQNEEDFLDSVNIIRNSRRPIEEQNEIIANLRNLLNVTLTLP